MVNKKIIISLFLITHHIIVTDSIRRLGPKDEQEVALKLRMQAARFQTVKRQKVSIETNTDETSVADYAGSFTKAFEHDPITGALTANGKKNYEKLILAMKTGLQADFNAIQRAPGSLRVFINPQAGLSFSMQGCDSALFALPAPPTLTSAWEAAEMLEVYLHAIARDVSFNDYGTGLNTDSDGNGGSITNKAAAVLQDLGTAYHGPRNGVGVVDSSVVFRGVSAGDKVGPYVSQFLLQPTYPLFPAGCAPFVGGLIGIPNLDQDILATKQRIPIPQKREFGVSWQDYIAIQNGLIPKQYNITDYDQTNRRYPINGRDLGGYVHGDSPYEPYYNAINILIYNGFPISKAFPYANGSIINESAGFNMGGPDAYGLIAGAAIEGFKAAWAQKWRCYRKLRPEAMAGLIHHAKTTNTNPYNLHNSLFVTHAGIDVLEWVKQFNGLQALTSYDPQQLLTPQEASTYLLSQMFPEGSPDHPAYPSGHATGAGAATTVLKAIFENSTLIKNKFAPVKPNPQDPTQLIPLTGEGENVMTVASELDKLASNIAIARDFAGVHWRSDAEEGILLGEQVAIRYLQDHARTYPEEGFTGYELTKRDGTRIRITAEAITVISTP